MNARRQVKPDDGLDPMTRLLSEYADGQVFVGYHQQWRTLFKAQRLGYITDDNILTESGRAFLRGKGIEA